MSEWGNPDVWKCVYPWLSKVGHEKSTRGTETSKYPKEKYSIEIPLVAASERGRAQTNQLAGWGCRTHIMRLKVREASGKLHQRRWKSCTINWIDLVSILSRTGHVKPCLNLGGPPSKPKYYLLTDSEQVPWGKDEKNPDKGSEIEFETVYLQTVRELL